MSSRNTAERTRLLRFAQVQDITKLSRSTVWRLEKAGEFPKRRQLSRQVVGWLEHEVMDWLNSRPVVEGESES
jgi:prophage regulatory protein